MQAEN